MSIISAFLSGIFAGASIISVGFLIIHLVTSRSAGLSTTTSKLKPPDRVRSKTEYNGYSAPPPKYEIETPNASRPLYPIPELKGSSTPPPKYQIPTPPKPVFKEGINMKEGSEIMDKTFAELKELSMPIIDYLKKKGYAHPTVVITPDRVKLMTDEASIPIPYYRTK